MGTGSTYVTTDIHGCKAALDALLSHVSFGTDDTLYVLGDLAERGPDSVGVLTWAMEAPDNVHLLRGNHDQSLLESLRLSGRELRMRFGDPWASSERMELIDQIREGMPYDGWETELTTFLDKLPYAAQVTVGEQTWTLVHAGLNPSRYGTKGPSTDNMTAIPCGVGQQRNYDLMWIRDAWLYSQDDAPTPTVHGHTPTIAWGNVQAAFARHELEAKGGDAQPLVVRNRVDIDCGCCYGQYGGLLCLLRLDDLTYSLANADGTLTTTDAKLPSPGGKAEKRRRFRWFF